MVDEKSKVDSINVDSIDIPSYAFKKKKKTDEELLEEQEAKEFDDPPEEDDDDDDYVPDDLERGRHVADEESITNSLQLAQVTTRASEVAKQFKEIPKEVKLAFLDKDDKNEVKHAQKNYRNFNYIRKTLKLQKIEDDEIIANRLEIYNVETVDDLEQYFINCNQEYMFKMLSDDEKAEIVAYLPSLERNGFNEDMKRHSDRIANIYTDYKDTNQVEDYVDDSGHLGDVVSTSVVSSGYLGNERNALTTSISATKDIMTGEQIKEKAKPERSTLGKFMKKFT